MSNYGEKHYLYMVYIYEIIDLDLICIYSFNIILARF